MNDDDNNKVLEVYKEQLLVFLDKEIYFADLDNEATDTSDHWFAAKKYAFEIVRDFVTDSISPYTTIGSH